MTALPEGLLPATPELLERITTQLGTGGPLGRIAIDVANCPSKHALLVQVCAAMNPPESMQGGTNLDAAYDLLTDLSWSPAEGWMVLVDARGLDDALKAMLYPLLADAQQWWREQRRFMQVWVAE